MTNDAADNMAAELALGLLEGEERAEALRRQLSDPAFAREVERWRDHFATLFPQVPSEEPPASLEARVLAANDPGPVTSRWWKPAALLATAALAVVSTVMLTSPDPVAPVEQPASPTLVAAFDVVGLDQPKVAIYDPDDARLTMPGPMPIPDGHNAQLWVSVDGETPRPLGTFSAVKGGVAAVAESDLPAGTEMMITFEPVGQPVTEPTGDTVAEGVLTTV
ncbi:anti-sigma factor [Sphingomicrobium clamense]|uniref:Anti-sigma factor n=1 Tax=Sphingomicrobium clamense TaxID=2851013 RepID=A0ABS6V4T0_9SPHN|nr:anti-sigma factor [Sphingomicrobium sp. B8]MBW0144549.1 anti-sigma factor [Sphingomicrobium sp. B8]